MLLSPISLVNFVCIFLLKSELLALSALVNIYLGLEHLDTTGYWILLLMQTVWYLNSKKVILSPLYNSYSLKISVCASFKNMMKFSFNICSVLTSLIITLVNWKGLNRKRKTSGWYWNSVENYNKASTML